MIIAVIGSGGREHSICKKISESPKITKIYCIPGNAGTSEIAENIEIDIVDSDLRIDTYRASGAGGQHVNTTDSAVRITHTPTNIVVQCQNERSQHKNKATAMKMLRSKLYQHEMEKRQAEADEVNANKKAIEWGSQIRSYVMHPYRLVKDLRTGVEQGNTDKVLDGDLMGFMEAWLVQQSTSEVSA